MRRVTGKHSLPDPPQSLYLSSWLPSFPFNGFQLHILAHCDAVWEGGNHPISLTEPEDDGCCEGDGGEECVSAAIIAGVDASPVLETPEHILNFVTLPIEVFVEASG